MKIQDLKSLLSPLRCLHFRDGQISGIAQHTQEVKSGYLFVAIPGEVVDGHTFISEAVKKGAIAIVAERSVTLTQPVVTFLVENSRLALAKLGDYYFDHPSKKLSVIGVTGTNGKTTTVSLIASILRIGDKKVGTLGTILYEIGRRAIPAPNTTPGSLALQSYLAEMVQSGLDMAVMEVSSHAVIQSRIAGIEFKAGVFTNLTEEHLDYHGSFERYRDAKAMFFKGLASNRLAIINVDDPSSEFMRGKVSCRTISYGIKGGEVKGKVLSNTVDGLTAQIDFGGNIKQIRSRLVGSYNLYNILAAASLAFGLDLPLDTIVSGIDEMHPVPGRLERVHTGKGFHAFVDYAHTDAALKNVIEVMRELTRRRLLVVFGCGGDRDRSKRARMGKVATTFADHVIVTSDNPRTEEPQAIVNEILKGVSGDNYDVILDRREAIASGVSLADPGDTLLVCGKGHETYQVLKDTVISFDDREAIRDAVEKNL